MPELVLKISNLKGSKLCTKADKMVDGFVGNKFFIENPIDTTALAETSTSYRKAVETTLRGDKAGQLAKEELKDIVKLNIEIVAYEVAKIATKTLLEKKVNLTEWQEILSSVNLDYRKKPQTRTLCNTIVDVLARNNEAKHCMEVSWKRDEMADNFVVHYRIKSSNNTFKEVFTSACKTMLTNLIRGQEYEFKVAGINSKGLGEFSALYYNIAL